MKSVELARGVLGLCELVRPQLLYLAVTGDQPAPGVVVVMRFLGARHAAQALLLSRAGRSWHRCGALVDLAHAASMVGVACGSPRWRLAAGIDAVLASAFAAMEAR